MKVYFFQTALVFARGRRGRTPNSTNRLFIEKVLLAGKKGISQGIRDFAMEFPGRMEDFLGNRGIPKGIIKGVLIIQM